MIADLAGGNGGTMATFFAASVVLGVAPGPDNIFVLTQSALYGPKAGLLVTMGLCTGLIGHSLAVACGVAALLQTSPWALALLKWIGAGYLVWLAIAAFRAVPREMAEEKGPSLNAFQLYRRGVIMNSTNPKVTLFFLAFLPQFVTPAGGSVPAQIMVLGGLFMLATILVFGTVAVLAGRLGSLLQSSARAQIALHRVAGLVYMGLALSIALTGIPTGSGQ